MKGGNIHIKLFIYTVYMLCFCSCNMPGSTPADHPGIVAQIISNAEQLLAVHSAGAVQYIDSSLAALPAPGPGDRYAFYEFKRAYYTDKQINYVKALLYADSMAAVLYPFYTDGQYNFLYAIALLKKGDALFSLKHYNKAYSAFYSARNSISQDNAVARARFLFEYNRRLADISYGKRLFADAAMWHKRALQQLDVVPDTNLFYTKQGCLDNLALSYSMAGQLDSAKNYYDAALHLIDNFKPLNAHQLRDKAIARGIVLGNMGTVYYKQGNMPRAEACFKESIAINAQPGYPNEDALITRIKLAALYTHTGRLKDATLIKDQLTATDDTLTGVSDKLQWLIFQADYASAMGNNVQANNLYRTYIQKTDNLNASKNALMSTDFISEFEVLQHQYDLIALQRQYRINIMLLAGAILLGIMAVCIAFLMYRSRLQDKTAALKLARRYSQLEMTLAALEKSNQQNAQFHRVLAHDLKNPISAIYSITQLMGDDDNRSEEDRELIDLMQLSSKNAINLIHDQLIEKGMTLKGQNKTPADLAELLHESVLLLRYKAEEKHQRIFLEPSKKSCTLNIYREGIWRVLNNLIVNAIKFSKDEQIIEVGYEVYDHEVVVFVKDKGIGIPPDIQQNLFLLSQEVKRNGTAGEQSFGLGLYTSRQIIEDHGGKIWYEENKPNGSIFKFSLPL